MTTLLKSKPPSATKTENCVTCAKFFSCKKEHKSIQYICGDFRLSGSKGPKKKLYMDEIQGMDIFDDLLKETKKGSKPQNYTKEVALEVGEAKAKFYDQLNALCFQDSFLASDTRLKLEELPKAPNYYEWLTGNDFLGMNREETPFPKQIEIGLKLFADVCPKCTPKFYTKKHEHDVDINYMMERIQLFDDGVCPRCHYTRWDGIQDGLLKDYRDLTMIAGQRSSKCLTGDALVKVPGGYVTMKNVIENPAYTHVFFNGKAHPITHKHKKGVQKVVNLHFNNGRTIGLTHKHLVLTTEGYLPADQCKFKAVRVDVSGASEVDDLLTDIVRKTVAGCTRLGLVFLLDTPNDALFMSDVLFSYGVQNHTSGRKVFVIKQEVSKLWPCFTDEKGDFPNHVDNNRHGRVDLTFLPLERPDTYVYPKPVCAEVKDIVDTLYNKMEGTLSSLPKAVQETLVNVKQQIARDIVVADRHVEGGIKRHFLLGIVKVFRDMPVGLIDQREVNRLETISKSIYLTVADVVRAGEQETYDITVPSLNCFASTGGVVVHNSVIVTQLTSYQLHRMFKLGNPAAYFQQLSGQAFNATYVANTLEQVARSLWTRLEHRLRYSPWYQHLTEVYKEASRSKGEELYSLKKTFAFWRIANLGVDIAANTGATLRGSTRWLASIDELGLMTSDPESPLNGLEINASLSNSLLTLRGASSRLRKKGVIDIPNICMLNVSSPMDYNDPIMTLARVQQQAGNKTSLVIHAPTWEINPDITREDLQTDFDLNPVKAMRDYGAQPPLSQAAFIDDVKRAKHILGNKKGNAVYLSQVHVKSKSGKLHTTADLKFRYLPAVGAKKRILALDAGEKNNGFALALAHFNDDGQLIYDSINEVTPTRGASINFRFMYDDVIYPICKKFNVAVVVSDRWQTTKILQDLEEDLNLIYYTYSVNYSDFISWREGLYDEDFRWPRCELPLDEVIKNTDRYPHGFIGYPIAHLLFQMVTVKDMGPKTVTKGHGFTDDLFRAVVLADAMSQNEEVFPLLMHGHEQTERQGGLVAISSFGGGGQPQPSSTVDVSRFIAIGGRGLGAGNNPQSGTVNKSAVGAIGRPR